MPSLLLKLNDFPCSFAFLISNPELTKTLNPYNSPARTYADPPEDPATSTRRGWAAADLTLHDCSIAEYEEENYGQGGKDQGEYGDYAGVRVPGGRSRAPDGRRHTLATSAPLQVRFLPQLPGRFNFKVFGLNELNIWVSGDLFCT